MPDSRYWIQHLGLAPHPEGGYFRETWRSAETIPPAGLPARFPGPRSFSTAIYYLLENLQFSAFHRIRSEEIWHYYAGTSALLLHVLSPDGRHSVARLCAAPPEPTFQAVVPAGHWFGAAVEEPGGYALLGCTVAPGFDFSDFEMARRDALLAAWPRHRALIESLTRPL